MEDILAKIEKENIEFVRFEFGDIDGVSRCKVIPARHVQEKSAGGEGIELAVLAWGTPSSSVPHYTTAIGWGNGIFRPDLSTFRTVPWLPNTALMLTEPTYSDGKPVTSYPRYIARQQLNRLHQMGYSLYSAHELEFCVYDAESKEPLHVSDPLSSLTTFVHSELLYAFSRGLTGSGFNVETMLTKLHPGHLEITYKPTFGIRAADNAHIFRTAVQEIAQKRGYMASFKAEPWAENARSASQYNHSLWDIEEKTNVMHDSTDDLGISEVARHWMAGILAHAPAISLLAAPSTNCRLTRPKVDLNPIMIPTNGTWGIDNRSCALRLKLQGNAGIYLENRLGSGLSNPYLFEAATVAAGIDGIVNKLPLPAPVIGSAFVKEDIPPGTRDLPCSLQGAIEAFQEDSVITEAFGKEFCAVFLGIKRHEIASGGLQNGGNGMTMKL